MVDGEKGKANSGFGPHSVKLREFKPREAERPHLEAAYQSGCSIASLRESRLSLALNISRPIPHAAGTRDAN
jgi:hypothetical protein